MKYGRCEEIEVCFYGGILRSKEEGVSIIYNRDGFY